MSVLKFPGSPISGAARWLARQLGDGERPGDIAFSRWIQESYANADAYQKVSKIWELSGHVSNNPAIVQAAKDAERMAPPKNQKNRRTAFRFVAFAGGAIAATIVVLVWPRHQLSRYVTAGGETKTIGLPDSSTVVLSPKTAMVVDYSKEIRLVHLVSGEALFTVRHFDARPFKVETGLGLVTAVGTQFDVRERNDATMSVDVLEGRVRVEDQASLNPTSLQLDAGEHIGIDKNQGFSQKQPAQPDRIRSWENGKLLFSEVNLQDAVDEMNMFSERQLVLVDKSLANRPISGLFRYGEAEVFVSAVNNAFGLGEGQSRVILRIVPSSAGHA